MKISSAFRIFLRASFFSCKLAAPVVVACKITAIAQNAKPFSQEAPKNWDKPPRNISRLKPNLSNRFPAMQGNFDLFFAEDVEELHPPQYKNNHTALLCEKPESEQSPLSLSSQQTNINPTNTETVTLKSTFESPATAPTFFLESAFTAETTSNIPNLPITDDPKTSPRELFWRIRQPFFLKSEFTAETTSNIPNLTITDDPKTSPQEPFWRIRQRFEKNPTQLTPKTKPLTSLQHAIPFTRINSRLDARKQKNSNPTPTTTPTTSPRPTIPFERINSRLDARKNQSPQS